MNWGEELREEHSRQRKHVKDLKKGRGETQCETEARWGWGTVRDKEGSKMSPELWAGLES